MKSKMLKKVSKYITLFDDCPLWFFGGEPHSCYSSSISAFPDMSWNIFVKQLFKEIIINTLILIGERFQSKRMTMYKIHNFCLTLQELLPSNINLEYDFSDKC